MTSPLHKNGYQDLTCLSKWGLALQLVALTLMAGGMLALGAITAPVVFGHFARPEAATVMGIIFQRYDRVLLVATGVLWLGESLRCLHLARKPAFMPEHPSVISYIRGALLLALTGTMLYSIFFVNADIAKMQAAQIKAEQSHQPAINPQAKIFEKTHKLSEKLYKANMVMALFLVILTPFTLTHPLWLTVASRQKLADAGSRNIDRRA
jgi:hypothetical protein